MRITHATALLALLAPALAAQRSTAADPLARAKAILATTPLVDGHNDLPWAIRESQSAPGDVEAYDLRTRTPHQTDLARMKAGHVGGQFWSVYIPGEIRDSGYARVQLEQIDIARRVIAKYPEALVTALTATDFRTAFRAGKVGSMLGMEGGHAIENSLGALRQYYALGVRYMTLTHNVTLDWADAALDSAKHGGLTPFGQEVVREMNRLGMLVDLSHVSPGVMSNALDVAQAPVIFSHSGARALIDHPRNIPDSILRRLPRNGGVVMVPFVPSFTSPAVRAHDLERDKIARASRQAHGADTIAMNRDIAQWLATHPAPKATLNDVANTIEYVRKVAGPDHVGIGSDYDGADDDFPVGLEDQSTYPALFAELIRRGWSDADLRKLAGENVLRALSQAEQVAKRLQQTRPASNRTIRELDARLRP